MSERPLSPHLGIYKPQLTSVLSILHRFTGVGLFAGGFLLLAWVASLALGADIYQKMMNILESPVGLILLSLWLFALYYHLLNGLRHLYWDMGRGFDLKTTYRTGWFVLGLSLVLTGATIFFKLWGGV
jgi:succinate dehydrogenase / fumarate reductase cytochrome b subunit